MYSVIIPVFRNADFVPALLSEFSAIARAVQKHHGMPTEFVFVVDASPDNSYALLSEALPNAPYRSQLILHARNFGSFAAIRTGLHAAKGDYFGVIAADLQEPPELLIRFLERLADDSHDIVIGVRNRERTLRQRDSQPTSSGRCTAALSCPTSQKAASTCSAATARSETSF